MTLAFFSRVLRGVAGASGFCIAVGLILSAFATVAAAQLPGQPMEFMLVHADNGSAGCRPDGSCIDWIAAEGVIEADSPAALRKMLASIGDRKLPIVLRSPGGNVDAAIEMGRLIRKRGLSVAVGGTRLRDCPANDLLCGRGWREGAKGTVYSVSYCLSACPYMLAGGVRRMFGLFSFVGVHQITMTYDDQRIRYRMEYRIINGKKKIISRQEISRQVIGQHDSTKVPKALKARIIAYFKEMGVDRSIFDMAMTATPASMRFLLQMEALKIGLITDEANAGDLVTAGACAIGQPLASCVAPASADPAALVADPPYETTDLYTFQDYLSKSGSFTLPAKKK
jgi:hypothetical protein